MAFLPHSSPALPRYATGLIVISRVFSLFQNEELLNLHDL